MFGLSKELENIWRTVCVRVCVYIERVMMGNWRMCQKKKKEKCYTRPRKQRENFFLIFFVFCFLKIYAATICCQLVHNFYESFRRTGGGTSARRIIVQFYTHFAKCCAK